MNSFYFNVYQYVNWAIDNWESLLLLTGALMALTLAHILLFVTLSD